MNSGIRTVKRRILSVITMLVITLGLFGNTRTEAKNSETPRFTLKYINDNTGIKITIAKNTRAESYGIYLSRVSVPLYNGYAPCESEAIDTDTYYNTCICYIERDGSEKRTFTLPGLPEGTYKIYVYAYDTYYEDGMRNRSVYAISKAKEVTIQPAAAPEKEKKKYDFSEAKAGDVITFGSYEQNGIMTDGKEDIEWVVLNKTDKQMTVISKYILDCLPFNMSDDPDTKTSWADCSLREWLNDKFYNTAFTKSERKLIKTVKVKNPRNKELGTLKGKTTKDKVYLLSLEDVLNPIYNFGTDRDEEDKNRMSHATPYVNGLFYHYIDINDEPVYGFCDTWLLRSLEGSGANAVDSSGAVDFTAANSETGIRPVITISVK